jgi:hypothetical protein
MNRNVRLALVLGGVAAAFYFGYLALRVLERSA